MLKNFRLGCCQNPLFGFLNINSLRNKIIDLREAVRELSLDYFVLSETKLDDSFPSAQFTIGDYEIRGRKDRNKHGGGLIEYVKMEILCKRLKEYEPKEIESICSEITISKKKWFCISIYRPPDYNNLKKIFCELTLTLNKASRNYDSFMIMGDFNIDINSLGNRCQLLDEFCDLFYLSYLVKTPICFTSTHKSTIDLIMTNKPKVFQKTRVTETGISDYHKLVSTFFKSHYSRLKPKVSYYGNYKNFDEQRFLNDLENTNFISISEDPDEHYDYLTTKFHEVVDKHAPLKKKFVRGNHALFMNKELRKAIYNRSRLKNKFCKNQTKENEEIYKKQRDKCVKLRKKSIKLYFSKITQNGIVTNKNFWKVIKPFLTNKGCIDGNEISIVNGDEIISDEKELVKTFNEHYINIVERSCGVKSQNLFQEGTSAHLTDNEKIDIIEKHYESHPSIIEIKNNLKPSHELNISTFQTNPSEVKEVDNVSRY